jgi:hypothetical protein
MSILLMAHSLLRWLILLLAVITMVKYLIGWFGNSQFKSMDRGLMSGFSGLMDLQVTLGIILLLWIGFAGGGFLMSHILHGVVMILAAVVAHLPARWKNADGRTRFQNNLFVIVASLVLIVVGIVLLAGI